MNIEKSKVVFASLMSNIVEYYDFGLYGVCALEMGRVFFPHSDPFITLMLQMLAFSMALLTRPFGGLFFGHIGDKFGRRTAIMISIIGISMASFVIAFLPGYDSIGLVAPIILCIIRIVQGLCIGGEGVGSAIFLIEHFEKSKPAFVGSIVQASAMGGVLLAQFIYSQIYQWDAHDAWRYAFFLGGCMGVVGLCFRSFTKESPAFNAIKRHKEQAPKAPIVILLQNCKKEMIYIACIASFATAFSYSTRTLLPGFFELSYGMDKMSATYYGEMALILFIILLPICGIYSDKIGHKRYMRITSYCAIICSIPIFMFLDLCAIKGAYLNFGLFLLALLAAMSCAAAYPYSINMIKNPGLRYSGVGTAWNLGVSLSGTLTLNLGVFIYAKCHPIAIGLYLSYISLLYLIASILFYRYHSDRS